MTSDLGSTAIAGRSMNADGTPTSVPWMDTEPGAAAETTRPPADLAAVVVTWFPDADCPACLRSVFMEAACSIVVDNGSDAASKARILEARTGILAPVHLIENADNRGVAAALNQGIAAARALGFRHVLLMDQDTRLLPGAMRHLTAVAEAFRNTHGRRAGVIGSSSVRAVDRTDDPVLAESASDRPWSEVKTVITSGSLYAVEIFDQVGGFREDFFIDHVDHEHCLRLRRAGLTIIRSESPTQVHRMGQWRICRTWRSLWKSRTVLEYSPQRVYYQVRNLIWISRAYRDLDPDYLVELRRKLRRKLRRSIVYLPGGRKILAAAVRGAWHGLAGRSGPFSMASPPGGARNLDAIGNRVR